MKRLTVIAGLSTLASALACTSLRRRSRTMPMATIEGTTVPALKRSPPDQICSASAAPVKSAVSPTTGSEK